MTLLTLSHFISKKRVGSMPWPGCRNDTPKSQQFLFGNCQTTPKPFDHWRARVLAHSGESGVRIAVMGAIGSRSATPAPQTRKRVPKGGWQQKVSQELEVEHIRKRAPDPHGGPSWRYSRKAVHLRSHQPRNPVRFRGVQGPLVASFLTSISSQWEAQQPAHAGRVEPQ